MPLTDLRAPIIARFGVCRCGNVLGIHGTRIPGALQAADWFSSTAASASSLPVLSEPHGCHTRQIATWAVVTAARPGLVVTQLLICRAPNEHLDSTAIQDLQAIWGLRHVKSFEKGL